MEQDAQGRTIYRGAYPELTLPAIFVGLLLGSLIALSIGYASLILGFSIEGSELAAIMGWGYTRKKRGGHLTPRKIHMTQQLFEVLSRRHTERDPSKPWVFWHSYWNNKSGERVEAPYKNRRKALKALCKKTGVKYSGFHALRHSGASVMENNNVPLGDIQKILGHENRSTTEIYLHTLGDSQRRAMEAYEQARKKSHTDSHTGTVAT